MRNSIMAVTMFTVACGYVGARALPEILLAPDYIATIDSVQARLYPFRLRCTKTMVPMNPLKCSNQSRASSIICEAFICSNMTLSHEQGVVCRYCSQL